MPFDFAQPPPQPLDMGGPQPPQQKHDAREWLKLAILMGAAAKAGPDAVRGLLGGWQQAQADRQALQHQRFQEGLQQQQFRSQDEQRKANERNQELVRRSEFLGRFANGLGGLDDPAAIDAYYKLHAGQASSFGVQPEELQSYIQSALPPDAVQRKKIAKRIASLSASERQLAHQTQSSLRMGDKVIPYEEWSAVDVGLVDPKTGQFPVAPTKPDVPNTTDEQDIADALAIAEKKAGRPLTPEERQAARRQAIKDLAGLRRQPSTKDPELADINKQIAQLRLDQMQSMGAAGVQMSPAQLRAAQAISDDYDKASKDYVTRVQAYQTINAAASNPSAAGDLALIFSFMKMLDPGSTVRETEFANAQNAAGVPDRIRNLWNRLRSGERLNPDQRADFVGQARAQMDQARVRQKGLMSVYGERARGLGIPENYAVIDYDKAFGITDAQQQSGGVQRPGGPNPFRRSAP